MRLAGEEAVHDVFLSYRFDTRLQIETLWLIVLSLWISNVSLSPLHPYSYLSMPSLSISLFQLSLSFSLSFVFFHFFFHFSSHPFSFQTLSLSYSLLSFPLLLKGWQAISVMLNWYTRNSRKRMLECGSIRQISSQGDTGSKNSLTAC